MVFTNDETSVTWTSPQMTEAVTKRTIVNTIDSGLDPNRFTEATMLGMRVFPVQERDKKPLGPWKKYQEDAASSAEVAAWDCSSYNVGVVTGRASGVLVLDVDDAAAADFIQTLDLPMTATLQTGRGAHMYFRHPGYDVANTVNINGYKLDFRGDGGFAVGAGSIHSTGAKYEWINSPDEVGFADLPEAVLKMLKPNPRLAYKAAASSETSEGPTRFSKWLRGTLDRAKSDLAAAETGGRNNALFLAGVKVARDVAGAGAEWKPFADELVKVAATIGLTPEETAATLVSCWNSGYQEPTPWMVTAREWIYLGKQDAFFHPASGNFLKEKGFNHTFASQCVARGPLGPFLTAGDYLTIVHDLTYDPSSSEILFNRDGLLWYNTYRAPGIEAINGDATPLHEFMTYLVPDEPERNHLLRVMAWTIRHPGQKVRHATIIRSEHQGIGKSMLAGIWKAMLGDSNARTVSSEEFASDYQGFLQETLLNVVEELALGSGRQFYNRVKDWITGDSTRVNEKYLARREWPLLVTFLILTNLKVPILIEEHDRRIFMIDTPAAPRPASYYSSLAIWWQGNLGIVRAFFNNVDLDGFDPYAQPPMTDAKRRLIADGRTNLEKDLSIAIHDKLGGFGRDLVTFEEIEKALGRSMFGKSKTDLVNALNNIGAMKLGQKRVKIRWIEESYYMPADSYRLSLWAIRNVKFWQTATAQDCAAEYASRDGAFASIGVGAMEVILDHFGIELIHGK